MKRHNPRTTYNEINSGLAAGFGTSPSGTTKQPVMTSELKGYREVRVKNPNDFSVKVGLRVEGRGKDSR